ncbi:C4-type zinc ribbon domain-containing protein [Desulfovibrio sp. OttesenSCG-928-F07]|nr:C4-type zinc ribbon domain-containing protein [Desulfovibrio sp. OttesenSCG-928-F07]
MSLYLKQIEQLVELQKVDDQIHVIRKELTSAPREIDELKANFQRVEEEKARVADKLDHLKEQEKRLNFDIEDDDTRIKKSKSKLMQVGNSKEYQAMMREMDSLEKMNKDREEEKKVMMEELERQNDAMREVEERHSELAAELAEKEAGLAERLEKAKNELKGLDERRRETSKDIPLPVLNRYEFIRERLEYPVIVPVNAGICSGCNISIPPQGYIELQKGKQILSCPNCQRLIFWSEHFCVEE